MESRAKYELGLAPKIIDRYIAREYLISYLIAMVVVLSMRVLIDLLIEFDEFAETTSSGAAPGALEVIRNISGYYGPKLFEYFRDFSGTIILLAAAFSLARLTRNNELVAVLASGISLKRVIAPIVFLGFLLNMLMVCDQELILPRLADKLSRRHDEMAELRLLHNLFLPDRDNSLVYARTYDPGTQTMTDVRILLRDKGRMISRITADQARWDGQAWVLSGAGACYFQIGDDQKNPAEIWKDISRWTSDLTPEYLWLQRHSAYKGLMSSAELTDLLRRNLRPADRADAISEKHFRFTDPVINMVMLLLGLPMLVSREKRSTKTAMFFAFAGAGGCFIVTFACKLLAGSGIYVGADLKQLLLTWLPVIVFLPLSVLALDGIKT